MSRPVLDPLERVRRPPAPGQRVWLAAGVLAAVAVLVPLDAAMRAPASVDALTVVNDSPYDVHVDVRAPGGRVLGLGTVPRERTMRFTTVLDQGDTWSFAFTAAGEAGGSVDVARRSLEQDGWTLAIPATVTSRLERAGLRPAPRTRAP